MGIQRTLTKLPVPTFGRLLGVNPLHFEGVNITEIQQVSCDRAWPQHGWQSADRTNREEVAIAIANAEADIERELGYRLLPAWETDERDPTVRANRPELLNVNQLDVRGYRQTARAKWGHLISGGIRTKTLLGADEGVAYASGVGDPADWEGVATVTATVDTGTDPCEIHVYYPEKDGADEFEIRPISVVIVGTTATITFPRELAITEAALDAIAWVAIPGADDSLFLTLVDVYRVFNDQQTQVSFLWEPIGGNCDCFTTGSSCTLCAFQTQTGCFVNRGDPRSSIVVFEPANWDPATEAFTAVNWLVSRTPDVLRLFYYAGLEDKSRPCSRIEMQQNWALAVARMAAARLDRPPCDCGRVWWERWTQDLAFTTGAEELSSYSMSRSDLSNPFGTRRGEVAAWKMIDGQEVRAGRRGIVVG